MATLPSGLSDAIEDDEDLARYLTSSRQFNAAMVKPAAFLPRDDKTSVFRHGSQPREVLWQIARDYALGDRTLHGAAILKARHVRAVPLEVVPSEPPPRHANIVGWASSASDPGESRAEGASSADSPACAAGSPYTDILNDRAGFGVPYLREDMEEQIENWGGWALPGMNGFPRGRLPAFRLGPTAGLRWLL